MTTHSALGGKKGGCIGYTKLDIGHPEYNVNNTRLAEFVTLGMVSVSCLVDPSPTRGCKYVKLLVPSSMADRIQGLIRVGLRRLNTIIQSQIIVTGFDFSTRGMIRSHSVIYYLIINI